MAVRNPLVMVSGLARELPTADTLGGALTPASVAAVGAVTGSNLSGTNTGDQTTVSGNAGTATKLVTARSIAITGDVVWSISAFDGSGNVTAAGTLATVNASPATYGSATAVPIIAVNNKGLVTSVTTATLGQWAAFTTPTATVLNPGPNLVYNASFRMGLAGWTQTGGAAAWSASNGVAIYIAPSAVDTVTLTSDFISLSSGTVHFISLADSSYNTTRTITLLAYDTSSVPVRVPANDVTFTPGISGLARGGISFTAASANYKLQIVVSHPGTGAYEYYQIKLIKIEQGSYMSAWTDEATTSAIYRYNDGTGTSVGDRQTLPLGNASTKTIGTTGATVPLNNTANTWAAAQTFGGAATSTSATAGIGYSTGAGGTVTQATSKATGVTLNTVAGAVTMNGAALAASTAVSFALTNSAIAATDVLILSIKSGATAGAYRASIDAVAAGSATVTLRNLSAGSLSEAVVINFAVIKAVAA